MWTSPAELPSYLMFVSCPPISAGLCVTAWIGAPANTPWKIMKIELNLYLNVTPLEAMALAQFVKRISSDEVLTHAVDKDEGYEMLTALEAMRQALKEQGYIRS